MLTSARTTFFLLLILSLIPGCISTLPPIGAPAIELKLQSFMTDKRYTYFELAHDGTLSFAGGFNAINKEAKPVMRLSAEQLIQLHSLINQSNLLTAKVTGPQRRKDSKRFHYELFLRMDGKQNHLIVNDDLVPGLTKLHNQLFRFQARARYNLPGIGD